MPKPFEDLPYKFTVTNYVSIFPTALPNMYMLLEPNLNDSNEYFVVAAFAFDRSDDMENYILGFHLPDLEGYKIAYIDSNDQVYFVEIDTFINGLTITRNHLENEYEEWKNKQLLNF